MVGHTSYKFGNYNPGHVNICSQPQRKVKLILTYGKNFQEVNDEPSTFFLFMVWEKKKNWQKMVLSAIYIFRIKSKRALPSPLFNFLIIRTTVKCPSFIFLLFGLLLSVLLPLSSHGLGCDNCSIYQHPNCFLAKIVTLHKLSYFVLKNWLRL